MKKILSILTLAITLSSCSLTRGSIGHSVQTQVQLKEANFTIIGSFTGSASAESFMGIGINQTDLYNRARAELSSKGIPTGTSRALINLTTDVRNCWFLMFRSTTVYVSADVVEFK